MGKLTAARNHLFNLFPRAFKRLLDAETPFCLVILDLMQFLAKVKHYTTSNESDITRLTESMCSVVESYMNSSEYKATRGLVVLLDTTKNVPTNKARTQKERDTATTTTTTESKILDESQYEALHSKGELGDLLTCGLEGESIWRNNNTKFQLYCAVTEGLLKIVPPRKDMQLILDDGISVHPELYKQRREEMINHYFFKEQSAYAQECLVSGLARHHFTERFVVSGDGSPIRRLPQTETGEADVKIPRFIVAGNNTRRYLVVSQDTDIIFILLLHLKSVLPHEPALELWLDTQTPVDRASGVSTPYRFINVKALYNAILELFAREYPSVENPVETLIFLVYALETDFTSSFETCLHVTPRVVWNTFAALHTEQEVLAKQGYLLFNDYVYDDKKPNDANHNRKEKAGAKRSTERQSLYPRRWWGILDSVVQYTHKEEADQYDITIDDVKAQSFLYLLCQQRVLKDLTALGYPQFDAKKGVHRTYIDTVDELFVWTSEIEGKLEAYRLSAQESKALGESNKRKAQEELVQKDALLKKQKKKEEVVTAYGVVVVTPRTVIKIPRPVSMGQRQVNLDALVDDIKQGESARLVADDIEEVDDGDKPVVVVVPTYKPMVIKKMEALLKEAVAKDYGVPRLQAMIARVYRTEWLMNYHQNGWKTTAYMTNFAEPHPLDATLSWHGWRAEEIPQSEESIRRGDFNNSYYTSVYEIGIQPGVLPFRVYKMVESDQVYNRNHLAYLNFGA